MAWLSPESVADIDDVEMRDLLSAKDVGKGRAILKRILRRLCTEPQSDLPSIPDNDADFTPDLARKIILHYQTLLTQERKGREQ